MTCRAREFPRFQRLRALDAVQGEFVFVEALQQRMNDGVAFGTAVELAKTTQVRLKLLRGE